MEKKFYSACIGATVTMSTGTFDFDEEYDEFPTFYIVVTDEDDMCAQYECLDMCIAEQIFLELKDLEDPYEDYHKVCEIYGLEYVG